MSELENELENELQNQLPPPEEIEAEMNRIQQLYREWTQLLPKLEAAHQDWLRGEAIMRELAHFYFDGRWSDYYQAIEDGLNIRPHTEEGECGIMWQDTLWDAFTDQQRLAWQRLRSSIDVLDRVSHKEDGEEAV